MSLRALRAVVRESQAGFRRRPSLVPEVVRATQIITDDDRQRQFPSPAIRQRAWSGQQRALLRQRRWLSNSARPPESEKRPPPGGWLRRQGAHLVETAKHYWLGTKLLWVDVQTSTGIAQRLLTGRMLTRRERKQLLRTTADLFRVVPFAVFVIVPFLEFLLPVALWLFPNMLPSTFQDATKREEKQKATLRARIALTTFLGDTLAELGEKSNIREDSVSANELAEFIAKARVGEIGAEDVTKFARAFRDELTLDNLKRPQLVVLCRYMSIGSYGPDAVLRFQLRNAIRELRADDQRIVYEGLDSLTRQEMQEACAERGMRALGLTKQEYRSQLEQWLELAANKQVPIALLIMSRAFTLTNVGDADPDAGHDKALADAVGSLDADILNEAVVEAAHATADNETPEMRERRLTSLANQNRLIAEERKDAEERQQDEERRTLEAAATVAAVDPALGTADSGGPDLQPTSTSSEPVAATVTGAPDTPLTATPDVAPEEGTWDRDVDTSASEAMQDNRADSVAAPAPAPPRAAPPSDREALDTIVRKLEVAEMLDVMAHLSALEREKNELGAIKAKLQDGDAPEPVVAKKDSKLEALKRKLTRMTNTLEAEIASVDKRLGDKLHIIDRDNDGVVDVRSSLPLTDCSLTGRRVARRHQGHPASQGQAQRQVHRRRRPRNLCRKYHARNRRQRGRHHDSRRNRTMVRRHFALRVTHSQARKSH